MQARTLIVVVLLNGAYVLGIIERYAKAGIVEVAYDMDK